MSNTKKTLLLGENFSTASGKLRKLILFDLVKQLGKDKCFRCTSRIDSVSDLSIEHTENWQSADNPSEVFYDTTKIAFSHLSCNSSAAAKTWQKYDTRKEQKREAFRRYYAKNSDKFLERKRQRYHQKKDRD